MRALDLNHGKMKGGGVIQSMRRCLSVFNMGN